MRKRPATEPCSNDAGSGGSGGSGSSGDKKAKLVEEQERSSSIGDLDSRFRHHNQPILMAVYQDHVTEQEKVIIVCVVPVGATNVRFRLLGTGPGTRTAIMEYDWPPIAYEIESLFREEIKKGDLATCDPKIMALKEDLKFTRQHITDNPKGSIELSLPIPVQTANKTISRNGVYRKDGSQAVIVELTAYESSYVVKPEDTKISFKKSGL